MSAAGNKEKIMASVPNQIGNHDAEQAAKAKSKYLGHPQRDASFTFTFTNFFHPIVGELIAKLNRDSLSGMLAGQLDPTLKQDFFTDYYKPDPADKGVQVTSFPKEIDVSVCGPYANYNWELFFHIPLTIAVHLSKTQRFAEAQRWFHYIFDPTSNDQSDEPPKRFWKFLAFRNPDNAMTIDEIVRILSTPGTELSDTDQCQQDSILQGYYAILNKPFQPHAVARTRHLAYQYCVVMKYLDNLIAWGDHLFQQDTVESMNEATQLYVLAANILGERPQPIPPRGTVKAKTFAQLKKYGLGPIGDALVDLESEFPFNLAALNSGTSGSSAGDSSSLFGIGRALYFCIPRNDTMLGYWDTIADRLFKIRHCMNIAGVVRPLALFDPPIDPGMLVKAAAAGIDIGSIVSGLNQPIGPVRSLILIQKALELCGEVRGLGNALLSALEKGDAEHLALVRQRHEIQIQQMAQEVRFLQWKSAQETTTSLLTSRATALERFHYYQRVLGLQANPNIEAPITLDRRELTEENFDEAYSALVGQYDKAVSVQAYPQLKLVGDASPASLAGLAGLFGASGPGRLYLNSNEDAELNSHLPRARDTGLLGSASNALAAAFAPVPDADVDLHYWGIGGKVKLNVGTALVAAAKIAGDVSGIIAGWEREQAGMASRTASYERRADDWLQQYNLSAHELMQIGRQILTLLIAEQIAHHEYLNIQQQITNAQEVDQFLHDKFTNEELYLWMQGEISRLYYEYYRFAFDTARKAERTMKQELMRPELDAQDFVKFNYWDGGRKGLLSGEALYLDVKRMEMAYYDNNKRELELTRHVSLRQLNPVALLTLKATSTCQVTIPEWLYDFDCPGHYMRRIKSVALSIPSVVGPYTSVNCTLSLLRSSLRKSPLPKDGVYARQGSEDDRFVDYIGAVQSIVTSGASNESGMFETNLRDERFLPFEGVGAESTWKLDLPKDYPAFDYATISDVILHVRYTARQGVDPTKVIAALDDLFQQTSPSNLALLFSLRHDFPTEWSAFFNSNGDFTMRLRKDYFPYSVQNETLSIDGLELYTMKGERVSNRSLVRRSVPIPDHLAEGLNGKDRYGDLQIAADANVLRHKPADGSDVPPVFLVVRYSL
jgi:hypothetical protein